LIDDPHSLFTKVKAASGIRPSSAGGGFHSGHFRNATFRLVSGGGDATVRGLPAACWVVKASFRPSGESPDAPSAIFASLVHLYSQTASPRSEGFFGVRQRDEALRAREEEI
jgi:hypothetical protein